MHPINNIIDTIAPITDRVVTNTGSGLLYTIEELFIIVLLLVYVEDLCEEAVFKEEVVFEGFDSTNAAALLGSRMSNVPSDNIPISKAF